MRVLKKTWFHVAVAAVTVTAGLSSTAEAADAVKPNIVVILADDLGWGELGAQGNKQGPSPSLSGGVRYLRSPRHSLEVEHYSYRRRLQKLSKRLAGRD